MFLNILKVAFRNLYRHFGYTFINVVGLAIGLACSILILLYVINELTYDRFNEKA
jgi:putative ABC transport system permease protein